MKSFLLALCNAVHKGKGKKNVNIEPQARRSWETVKRRLIACPAGAPAGGAIVEIEKNA
jgi:hypothetical protein